jgi:ABC-type glutathione transport system ATPase component
MSPVDLLEVRDLSVDTRVGRPIVSNVSFTIPAGAIVGLFGESGCGKTTLSLAVLRLLDARNFTIRGSIRLRGRELSGLPERRMEAVRGAQIAMVFQDPLLSLNPVLRAGRQVSEAIRAHRRPASGEVESLLELAGLRDVPRIRDAWPHELSGGERQRVALALALAGRPGLIIADEPFSALDATLVVQLTALFRDLQRQTGASFLLISHDPGVLAHTADSVLVMHAGEIVERGTPGRVFGHPSHPYTAGLLAAMAGVHRPPGESAYG